MSQSSIQTHQFDNGFKLVFEAMPWLSSASFTFLFPLGAATDPAGQEGSAAVLNDWLYRGAGELSSQALSDALDGLGVRRGGGAGKEYSTFSASLLSTSLKETLALYTDILRRPKLEPIEFEPARTLAGQELASLGDSPTQQLFETLAKRYFKSAHGNSSYGSAEGLAALTASSVEADYKTRLAPEGAILSVAGGLEWQEVLDTTASLFADWQGKSVSLPEVAVYEARQEHISEETSQVQIGVAYEAVAPGEAGWYENALAMSVLSGGMGARLFTEVREKRGLVYSVAALSRAVRGFGYSLAYAGTTTERANETLEVLLDELRRLKRGVTPDELERARTGLLSQLVMQGESSGARASALARDSFLLDKARSIDEVKEALTGIEVDSVNTYLAAHYDPSFTIMTLGAKPLAEVRYA